jgi:hypothetical protein
MCQCGKPHLNQLSRSIFVAYAIYSLYFKVSLWGGIAAPVSNYLFWYYVFHHNGMGYGKIKSIFVFLF